jgi:rubredoxin
MRFRPYGHQMSAGSLLKFRLMRKYRCTVCGYLYDPDVGDMTAGIASGTGFEDLPDTWVCPVCGADVAEFRPAE